MKRATSHRTNIAKLILAHAAIIALFTQPWLIAVFSDALALITGQTDLPLHEQLLRGLSTLSTVALVVAVATAVWYLLARKRGH